MNCLRRRLAGMNSLYLPLTWALSGRGSSYKSSSELRMSVMIASSSLAVPSKITSRNRLVIQGSLFLICLFRRV